ncbi:hypothetical protein ACFHWS_17330 [Micromonospora sp. LOL_013]|uniref:hypothetical protein n=1 Tax=unclassified Micromonospora TaxID=2617518 RepID=UPI003A892C94
MDLRGMRGSVALTRREELLAEYAGATVSLSGYMATCLLDAMIDLADNRSEYLYWRFMGW